MFVRDGEQLNLNGKELDDTEQWVKKELASIRATKKIFVFKATMKPVKLVDDHGEEHIDHRGISIPTVSMFSNKISGLTESWQLILSAGSFKRTSNGVDVKREPGIVVSTEGLYLDSNRDYEKIFYLKHISKSIANKRIYLEDKAADAKKFDEELMLQDEAMRLISSPTSPISVDTCGTEDVMRQIAMAWGIIGAPQMTYSEVKINLRNRVIKCQQDYATTNRGYKEFVDDANRLGDSDKRSTILLAIDRGILKFEDNSWFVKTREGSKQFLISIPPTEVSSKDDWLIRHLVKKENHYFYELTESLLQEPIAERIVPLQKDLTRAEMLEIAKNELGWPHAKVFSRKDDFLKGIVDNKTKYEE